MMRQRRFWGSVAALCAGLAGAFAVPAAATASVVSAGSAGSATQAGPTVTVAPTTDLVDGSVVTTTFSGVDPDTYVVAAQCRAGATSPFEECASDATYEGSDQAGNATVTLRVDTTFVAGFGEAAETVDCRVADACVILWSADDETVTSVPLHFVADAPLAPPPTVAVTPDHDLSDHHDVDVTASGLVWSTGVDVFQCAADPVDYRDCSFANADFADIGVTGTFTGTFQADAVIETGDEELVDCREPDACVLAVTQDQARPGPKTAFAALSFDPDAVVVPPTIAVDPDDDLVDGQVVALTGSGFPADDEVGIRLCSADLESESCEWIEYGFTDEEGMVELDLPVYAVLDTPGGDIDCRTADDPCELVASNGSPGSPRAAHVPLHFDPDSPLKPAPALEVDPSTNLADDANVTVTGTDFTPQEYAVAQVCVAGDGPYERCDADNSTYAEVDADGGFALEMGVTATFHAEYWNGEDEPVNVDVDCRVAPGCEMVAVDGGGRELVARSALTFAPEPPEGDQRYIDRVFDEVDVTHDVVYRTTVDDHGAPVELKLDIYEPRGDTAAKRPAVLWMHGGWFDDGSKADMASYATEFARRGYVAISVDYRTLHSLSRDDPRPIRDAMLAGYDNAAAALAFVHEHADHYRIDHEAIAVGGAEAGAVNAFDLAYLPGEHARTGSNDIAAALAIAGVSLGSPDAGDAPLMAFNASEDLTAPLHMAQWTCADAVEVDAHCESVAYQGNPGNLEFAKQRDIVRRSALFLADEVLRPLGYIDDGHATTTTTEHEHTTTTGSGASTTSTTTHGGNLPKTGSDSTMPLLLVGLVLSGVGAGLVFLARRRRDGRGGGGGLPGAVAGLLLIAVALPALGRDGSSASAQEVPPADEPTTTVPDDTSTTLPPTTVDPSTTSTTGHQHPTSSVPGTSTTMGSTTTTHHGGGDPGFPSDWTPDQVAYATKLIDDTEMSLERFDTQAVLPLMGYTWIFDGTAVGSYQHWINVYRIGFSDSTIDTSRPESLVYRQTEDGPVLEAAMYILGANFVGVDSVPEDLAWLPDWHVHDNLCAEGFPPRLVGLTDENGQCTRGYKLTTPPMLHVWIVDTECGRFAGVDENGLICHHHPED